MKSVRKRKKGYKISIIIFLIIIILLCSFLLFLIFYNDNSNIEYSLNGYDTITLDVFSSYEELGAKAFYKDEDISNLIDINSNVDVNKVGNYTIEYKIDYKNKEEILYRYVNIVDNEKPVIKLKGKDNITVYLNEKYKEQGAIASDNYDGDITDNIEIEGNVDNSVEGTYELIYKVSDSSNNSSSVKRNITVKKKPLVHKDGVAVLNYHFFYDTETSCGGWNCLHVSKLEEHLKYLKENNYKTLTMNEFVSYMYGNLEIPQKSVLITIDDGAMGTSFINGNRLIPLLEKYQLHATLFLITSWWDIKNYKSDYLDVESHSYDMHIEKYCSGVSRGAKMLCLSDEEVLADLQSSINTLGTKTAFCYPFYAYTQHSMELVQQAGFKLAFVGGESKATRSTNKYKIPRYYMYKTTTVVQFNHMIA